MKSQAHFPLVMLSVLLLCAAGLRAGPPGGSSAPERAAADANSQPVSVGNERVAVLIGFRNVPGPSEQALVRSQGGVIKYSYHLVPGIAASLPQPAAAALAGNPAVTHVEPDGKVYATDAELDNAWGVKRIGAGVVHAPPNSNTGLGVKVAIIDTGIDYTHPELDGNYHGGKDFVNNDDDPLDDHGHGTHVAGTIAAEDNGEAAAGVVGVAPGAHLYALKILDRSGSGNDSDLIAAMQWAVDNSMQVVNLSLGTPTDPGTLVKQAFDNAAAHGVVTVAAAGNRDWLYILFGIEMPVQWPAAYDSVIAVSAIKSSDQWANFSCSGPEVELAAPGDSIYSTIPGGYGVMSGTSMAAPHAAGAAALVIAAGYSDVRGRLASTADDLGTAGRDKYYGFGLVDADEAAIRASIQPPVAGFSGNPTSGTAPLAVQFTDQSTGSVSSWSWDFGDGGTSTQQSPSYTYTAAGVYTVSLTVTNSGGSNTVSKVNYINVTQAQGPTADFTGTPTSGNAPLTVNFAKQSTGSVSSWSWALGDGAGSTEQNPSHTYVAAGTYTVALIVTGPGGSNTATKDNYVTVTQTPAPPPPMTPYVTIVMSKQKLSKQWRALATVTIRENDSGGVPIAGAVVAGHWESPVYAADVSGTTDSAGNIAFQTKWLKSKGPITVYFVVDGITIGGQPYNTWSGETSDFISGP